MAHRGEEFALGRTRTLSLRPGGKQCGFIGFARIDVAYRGDKTSRLTGFVVQPLQRGFDPDPGSIAMAETVHVHASVTLTSRHFGQERIQTGRILGMDRLLRARADKLVRFVA